jgi:hypothetical protein
LHAGQLDNPKRFRAKWIPVRVKKTRPNNDWKETRR